ncbi:FAD/NAD(P)-binding protein [Luteimonas deserti]|uniref:FAD/NAD(P)-binding protein n=1 Tax=Luteimonas deserti TaxID=2752306 RepID=A0A7Z0QP91_9GAMM|nr:FAD-dependent oxidoreductase [Luteimonas deserti]NYZ62173.1 FAD/NAD(P)-binding protein [Luteimonas deserti]
MTDPTHADIDVVIVGGGAAGALTALHLLARGGLRIAVIEPRGVVGLGAAYSTSRSEHLLNVNAARMSAFDAEPDDFLRFLDREGHGAPEDLAARFMPRREYGRYLQARLAAQPGFDAVRVYAMDAVDVVPAAPGHAVSLSDGTVLHTRAVVLALGNRPGGPPVAATDIADGALVEAWDYARVAAIDPDADVVIVGAGLSMVDTVLTLQANGHRARVLAISRHGVMPLPHAPGTRPQPGGVEPLLALGVRDRLRQLRRWAAEARADGGRWQDALERLRPHVQSLWQSWPPVEQRRFLRHAVRQWDIHRHRIAPDVHAQLQAMRHSGRFALHAGRLDAISPAPEGRVCIEWRTRGGSERMHTVTHTVVNATGAETRASRPAGSVLPALLARGLLRPGPHAIGIDTADTGQVLDACGAAVPGLWTLGALRIGSLWESIAMPEVRGQAERLATSLALALRTTS